MQNTLLTVAEVAECLSCGRRMIYRLCKTDGTFPYIREGRKILFCSEAIRRWAEVGWVELNVIQKEK